MLYFITGNQGKFRDISALVPQVELLKLDLDEIQSLDPKDIIQHKLEQAAAQHEGEFIVEDTSLSLTCLQGLPGPFIKWFEDTIGVDGLAALALKHNDHTATARSTIGYRDSSGRNHFFVGELDGEIVPPTGDLDFGWGPIFLPHGQLKTFGEMTVDEKNAISMRGLAARQLAAHLQR